MWNRFFLWRITQNVSDSRTLSSPSFRTLRNVSLLKRFWNRPLFATQQRACSTTNTKKGPIIVQPFGAEYLTQPTINIVWGLLLFAGALKSWSITSRLTKDLELERKEKVNIKRKNDEFKFIAAKKITSDLEKELKLNQKQKEKVDRVVNDALEMESTEMEKPKVELKVEDPDRLKL